MELIYTYMNTNINEKVTWKELLIGLGVFLGTKYIIKDYKNYTFLNSLYNIANSELKDDSLSLEVKQRIINDVKESDLFAKYGKDYMLDSLQKATIIITDKDIFDESNGFYIHLPNILENFKIINLLTFHKKPSSDNIIFIHNKTLEDKSFDGVLTHELYHYVDRLLENRNEALFTNYDSINQVELEKKLNRIIDKDVLGIMKKINLDKDIINDLLDNKEYFTSNKEIFARVNTLRSNMKKEGIIKNINEELNDDIIRSYINENIIKEENIESVISDITISLIILK
jgi:hypothetical protein